MKKAQISINTLIIAALVLLVIVVMIIIFTTKTRETNKVIGNCINYGGICSQRCNSEEGFARSAILTCKGEDVCCLRIEKRGEGEIVRENLFD